MNYLRKNKHIQQADINRKQRVNIDIIQYDCVLMIYSAQNEDVTKVRNQQKGCNKNQVSLNSIAIKFSTDQFSSSLFCVHTHTFFALD